MLGRIHSIETMGLVDGPGIRCVVFMQGCRLRCKYCHNPDTWNEKDGENISSEDLVTKLLRYKDYFGKDGGVTFSGGEPLLQADFLIESLAMCRDKGIHTCIDTSGYGYGDYNKILQYTDLVLLDIKHIFDKDYKSLTGKDMVVSLDFLNACIANDIPLWISHVMVPGITDNDEFVNCLADKLAKIPNIKNIRILPYHHLGVHKYNELGIDYSLNGTEAMDPVRAKEYETYLNKKYKERDYAD